MAEPAKKVYRKREPKKSPEEKALEQLAKPGRCFYVGRHATFLECDLQDALEFSRDPGDRWRALQRLKHAKDTVLAKFPKKEAGTAQLSSIRRNIDIAVKAIGALGAGEDPGKLEAGRTSIERAMKDAGDLAEHVGRGCGFR